MKCLRWFCRVICAESCFQLSDRSSVNTEWKRHVWCVEMSVGYSTIYEVPCDLWRVWEYGRHISTGMEAMLRAIENAEILWVRVVKAVGQCNPQNYRNIYDYNAILLIWDQPQASTSTHMNVGLLQRLATITTSFRSLATSYYPFS